MRNLVIVTCSSSSIFASSTHYHHHHHHHHNFLSHKQQSPYFHNFIFLSLSKPTSPLPPSSSSSSSTASSAPNSPHLYPLSFDSTNTDLNLYAEIGSKLVEDGRFEDFEVVVNTVLNSGVNNNGCLNFGKMLNSKVVVGGIIDGLNQGRIKDVIGFLGCLSKLHVDLLGMFDGASMGLLKRECVRILSVGYLFKAVELMEALARVKLGLKD